MVIFRADLPAPIEWRCDACGDEGVIFAARADPDGADPEAPGAFLDVDVQDLDELIGFVAAETNHEDDRRRQKRLDSAFNALSEALEALDGR